MNWSSLALQVPTYTSSLGTRFFRGSGSETTPPSNAADVQPTRIPTQMAAQKQPVVHVVDFSDVNWSSQPAALHHRHGSKIRLSENNTVAERETSLMGTVRASIFPNLARRNGGLVMTAKPVSVGTVFQVTVLKKLQDWRGSLVSVVIDLKATPIKLYVSGRF